LLSCAYISFGIFIWDVYQMFGNPYEPRKKECVIRTIYDICVLLVFMNANFLFHHRCRIGLYVSCIVLLSFVFILHTIIIVFYYKWWLAEPDLAINYKLAILEDVTVMAMSLVHFVSLIAGVFAVFEWHDLKFQISQQAGSTFVKHLFYLFQFFMLIPTILWIIVLAGDSKAIQFGLCLITVIGYSSSSLLGIIHIIFKDIYSVTLRLTSTTLALIAHTKCILILSAPLFSGTSECLILPTQIAFSCLLLIPVLDIIISIRHAPSL